MTSRESGATASAVRQRLLDAADELFYAEGVQSVGVDRVIERAGVAKATLYRTFGSKEKLVAAYLDARHARTLGVFERAVERVRDPRARLLAVFDAQGRMIRAQDYRGCAFARAVAEPSSGPEVERATAAYRADVLGLLRRLAAETDADDPEELARGLYLVFHSAATLGAMDRTLRGSLRRTAERLLDAAGVTGAEGASDARG